MFHTKDKSNRQFHKSDTIIEDWSLNIAFQKLKKRHISTEICTMFLKKCPDTEVSCTARSSASKTPSVRLPTPLRTRLRSQNPFLFDDLISTFCSTSGFFQTTVMSLGKQLEITFLIGQYTRVVEIAHWVRVSKEDFSWRKNISQVLEWGSVPCCSSLGTRQLKAKYPKLSIINAQSVSAAKVSRKAFKGPGKFF